MALLSKGAHVSENRRSSKKPDSWQGCSPQKSLERVPLGEERELEL